MLVSSINGPLGSKAGYGDQSRLPAKFDANAWPTVLFYRGVILSAVHDEIRLGQIGALDETLMLFDPHILFEIFGQEYNSSAFMTDEVRFQYDALLEDLKLGLRTLGTSEICELPAVSDWVDTSDWAGV